MSTQDKLERVLRDIHVLISRSELYDKTGEKIIVEKKKMFEQLNQLNACIYEMMDEYEVTQQSRDKADREARKRGDKIVWNASRNAEDVYAAAVLYTDDALTRIQNIMDETNKSVLEIMNKAQDNLKERKEIIHENQSELKSQLQDMVDTEKYIKIIEERNKEIEKEKQAAADVDVKPKRRERTPYAAIKPEIRVNPEYFEKIGKSLEVEDLNHEVEDTAVTTPSGDDSAKPQAANITKSKPKITIDLDSEYFKWKKKDKTAEK